MAATRNAVPEIATQNCIGYISVATKDGEYVSYTKDGSGYNIIAFDFTAAAGTSPRRTEVRTWVTLNNAQFDPAAFSADFANWQNNNWNTFFLSPEGSNRKSVFEILTDDANVWVPKLEEFYDSATGKTDMQSIAATIAQHIDGKLIGYQLVQRVDTVKGEYDADGKPKRVRVDDVTIGNKFFDPNGRPPKDGINTFVPF